MLRRFDLLGCLLCILLVVFVKRYYYKPRYMHSSHWQCLTQPTSPSPPLLSLPTLWGHWRQSYCHVSGTFGLAIWPFACCSLLLICFNELSCDFIERIGQRERVTATKRRLLSEEGRGGKGKTLRKAATVAICLLTCIITSAIALAHAAPPHLFATPPPHTHTCSSYSFVGETVHPSHTHRPASLHLV